MRSAALPLWAIFALLVVVLPVVLARLPQETPAQVAPTYGAHVEVLSHNCIGLCWGK